MSVTKVVPSLPAPVDEEHPKDMINDSATFYKLPDTLRNWPYERTINPYYHVGKAESLAWVESFKAFSPAAQRVFNKYDFNFFRISCDFMNAFFAVDDGTDGLNTESATSYCEITMDAILHPDKPRPEGEPIIGEMMRQFWERALAYAPRAAQERCVQTWRACMDSIITQASRRDMPHDHDHPTTMCTFAEYMDLRNHNIGVYPSLVFMEMSLKLDVPHDVMEHPTLAALNRLTTEMIFLANDIFSYKKEIVTNNAAYNAITVVMHNDKVGIDGAVQCISDLHDELVEKFLFLRDEVREKIMFPSYGEDLDRQIELYIDGLGQWVRGHDEWSFGSCRYFGEDGLHVQKTRKVIIS